MLRKTMTGLKLKGKEYGYFKTLYGKPYINALQASQRYFRTLYGKPYVKALNAQLVQKTPIVQSK